MKIFAGKVKPFHALITVTVVNTVQQREFANSMTYQGVGLGAAVGLSSATSSLPSIEEVGSRGSLATPLMRR